eukprot:3475591-Rhodomonas_salina.1
MLICWNLTQHSANRPWTTPGSNLSGLEQRRTKWRDSGSADASGVTVKIADLQQGTKVFGSRFHYKIKRHSDTMQLKKPKVRLVVQGNQMQEGEHYEDAFAPVPRTTATRILMALAVGNNMHLHSMDI